jgi:hypothetical protein
MENVNLGHEDNNANTQLCVVNLVPKYVAQGLLKTWKGEKALTTPNLLYTLL